MTRRDRVADAREIARLHRPERFGLCTCGRPVPCRVAEAVGAILATPGRAVGRARVMRSSGDGRLNGP